MPLEIIEIIQSIHGVTCVLSRRMGRIKRSTIVLLVRFVYFSREKTNFVIVVVVVVISMMAAFPNNGYTLRRISYRGYHRNVLRIVLLKRTKKGYSFVPTPPLAPIVQDRTIKKTQTGYLGFVFLFFFFCFYNAFSNVIVLRFDRRS